jgi:hypothetical protein
MANYRQEGDIDPKPTGELQVAKGPNARIALSVEHLFWPVCALIMLFGLILRLPDLSRSLWLDETYSIWFASLPLHRLWTEVPLYETHPPFYYTLLKGWSAVFGTTEIALRSFSMLTSVMTILVVAISGRVLRAGAFGDRVSLIAAFFLAINAGNISFAQQARPYALQTLTATIAILGALFLIRTIGERKRDVQADMRTLLPAAAALAFGMGLTLWLHNTSFIIGFGLWTGLAIALYLAQGNRWHWLVFLISGFGALLIWSPFLPMFLRQTTGFSGNIFWVALNPVHDLLGAWSMVAGGDRPLPFIATFALVGLVVLWRTNKSWAALLICFLFIPWTTILSVSYLLKPIFINRLFEWMAPTVLTLAAIGILAGLRNTLPRLVAIFAVALFCLIETRVYYATPKEDWRGTIQTIRDGMQPGDLVVANASSISLPFSYYDKDALTSPDVFFVPAPYPVLNADGAKAFGVPKAVPDDISRLNDALKEHTRVWFVEMRPDLFDPDGLVMAAISASRKSVRSNTQDGIRLTLFQ